MLPITQLVQVLNLAVGEIVVIPDMPIAVMGICNWRGEILWLVDLGQLLGFEPLFIQDAQQPNYTMLVIQNQDRVVGFVVNQVGETIYCNPTEMQSLPPAERETPELMRCLQGYCLDTKGDLLLALDGKALVESLLSHLNT
jgi:positive phototaxis protein PixI